MRYLWLSVLLLGFYANALAQEAGGAEGAWEFSADSVRNERDLQTTIAEGNVVIEQAAEGGTRRLQADKVIYNRKEDVMTAIGNVKMWDEKETFYEFDYAEISGDFKHAVIEKLQVRLKNYGQLTADSAKRAEHLSVFENPSYSACDVCADDPESSLLWELKAKRVIHDDQQKLLKYYNTQLFFGGVPIFYMPYFYYPDPTVKRQSGFLLPRLGTNRNIGSYFSVPYFITLGDHADLTVNPIFTTEGGQVLSGEFRGRGSRSQLDGTVSFTEAAETRGNIVASRVDKNADRWHVDISGKADIDELWRAGFNINRASDRNYFRRYPFWQDPGNFLQSRIYIERLEKRNYINATAYSFQDLRLQDNQPTPRIYPNIDAYFYGDRDSVGGFWGLYGNFRVQDISKQVRDRRLYGRASYQHSHYSELGYAAVTGLNFYGKVQSSDFESPRNAFGNAVKDDNSARFLPQAGLRLSMPFERQNRGGTQIIEPLVAVYVAPNGSNNRNLNNSDANIFTLDSHNIMQAHRLGGVDRFDGGQRIAYGMNLKHYRRGLNLKGFLGQSYEFTEDKILAEELKITHGTSDIIVGALANIDLNDDRGWLNFDNQLQLDRSDSQANRYFSQASFGGEDFTLHSNYLYIRERNAIENQEQIGFTGDRKLSKYWRGGLFTTIDWGRKDPTSTSRTRRYGGRFVYDDECFTLNISASRDFTRNPDVQAGYSVAVSFDLKTLGDFGHSAKNFARSVSGF